MQGKFSVSKFVCKFFLHIIIIIISIIIIIIVIIVVFHHDFFILSQMVFFCNVSNYISLCYPFCLFNTIMYFILVCHILKHFAYNDNPSSASNFMFNDVYFSVKAYLLYFCYVILFILCRRKINKSNQIKSKLANAFNP